MTSPLVKPPTRSAIKNQAAVKINLTLNQGTWRYLMTTRRFLVWAVGLVGLAVVLILAVVIPQVQSIFDVQAQLSKQTKLVQQLQQKSVQLQEVVKSPSFGQIDQVNLVLPSKKPLLELLASLNQTVATSGVSVASIELAPGSIASSGAEQKTSLANKGGPKDYDKVDVILSIRGGLEDINNFLAETEKTAPFTSITKITLNKLTARPGVVTETEQFEAQLQVTTYFYTKSVTSALEAPLPNLGSTQEDTIKKITEFTFPAFTPQSGIQEGNLEDLFGVELQRAVQE